MFFWEAWSQLMTAAGLSIPFYFIWKRLAPLYLVQLPKAYLDIPFWHCMGAFVILAIVRVMIFPSRISVMKRHEWDWKWK